MKLLEKTIFKHKNEQISYLNLINNNYIEQLHKVIQQRDDLEAQLEELNEINARLMQIINNEKAEKKKIAGKCGGLTKRINKLLKENEDLKSLYYLQKEETEAVKKEFEDFKKGKYIVKELKAEKVPRRRQVMKVRDAQLTSNIIAKIKPSEEKVD